MPRITRSEICPCPDPLTGCPWSSAGRCGCLHQAPCPSPSCQGFLLVATGLIRGSLRFASGPGIITIELLKRSPDALVVVAWWVI